MVYNSKIHLILSRLYLMRTLSYSQIYDFVFKPSGCTESYCSNTIKKMVSDYLYATKVGHYKSESYYFITKKGINFLKEHGIIPIGQTSVTTVPLHNPLIPSEIKIKDMYVKHQLALNNFVLMFEQIFSATNFTYHDEIYTSSIFSNIRPDGIIKIGNTCLFLEMDMNTERKGRLQNKWNNYRNFLNSNEYYNLEANIKVLFILNGVQKHSTRENEIKKMILDEFEDVLSPKFNFYVTTESELLIILQKMAVSTFPLSRFAGTSLEKLGFKTSLMNLDKNDILSVYDSIIYSYKPTEDNKIDKLNNEPLEFFIDDAIDGNLYSYKKLKLSATFSAAFKSKRKRYIKYLIIVPSEQDAYQLLSLSDSFFDNVYFTTLSNLNNSKNVFDAVFQISRSGVVTKFPNSDLRMPQEYLYLNKFL